jgi:hypothetical protein
VAFLLLALSVCAFYNLYDTWHDITGTPFGAFGGSLKSLTATDLATASSKAALASGNVQSKSTNVFSHPPSFLDWSFHCGFCFCWKRCPNINWRSLLCPPCFSALWYPYSNSCPDHQSIMWKWIPVHCERGPGHYFGGFQCVSMFWWFFLACCVLLAQMIFIRDWEYEPGTTGGVWAQVSLGRKLGRWHEG